MMCPPVFHALPYAAYPIRQCRTMSATVDKVVKKLWTCGIACQATSGAYATHLNQLESRSRSCGYHQSSRPRTAFVFFVDIVVGLTSGRYDPIIDVDV